jgi:hypothetical protein
MHGRQGITSPVGRSIQSLGPTLDMRRALVLTLLRYLPLWLALAGVVVGAVWSHGSDDYWITAPWLVIASLPFCLISLLITNKIAAKWPNTDRSFGNGRKW